MKQKLKAGHILYLLAITIVLIALIVGNVFCYLYSGVITTALCGTGVSFGSTDAQKAYEEGDALVREIAGESIVMLKNDGLLPLDKSVNKVNLFGYAACDSGFLLRGVGSGSSTINEGGKLTLRGAFEEVGISCNTELLNGYEALKFPEYVAPNAYQIRNETSEFYTDAIIKNAKKFSNTAIVVIARNGGENIGVKEIPNTQTILTEKGTETNNMRTTLEATKYEEELLDLVCENFANVIVILNSANSMFTGFLNDKRIDAAFFVGLTGQSGTAGIPKVIRGDVTPSGKLTDTYAYDPNSQPSFHNYYKLDTSVQYLEDIYFGYKWYETADAEGFFDEVHNDYGDGYDGVVQYPFGFGLSYTDFEWTIKDTTVKDGGTFDENTAFTITVTVNNTGDYAGKDVVECYVTPPYEKGKVEKSASNLVAFAKTPLIEPGDSADVILEFTPYDFASYDCYDKNGNGFAGYELDAGTYGIKLMTDAHHVKGPDFIINAELEEEYIYEFDPVTEVEVYNRFTGRDAYADVPIDGSTVDAETTYLSRSDFAGTMPQAITHAPTDNSNSIGKAGTYKNDVYDTDVMPTTGKDAGLRLVTKEDGSPASFSDLNSSGTALVANEELFEELSDYNSKTWSAFIDQMTVNELATLVQWGGFRTAAIVSIGKPRAYDTDGPAGYNNSVLSNGTEQTESSGWTAYPCETIIGCSWDVELLGRMGTAIGMQGNATAVSGWYAPGVNLHRSPFCSRNFEYYSEDGLLSGKLAAALIQKVRSMGVYCYVKHFACDELGQNPYNTCTWLTEQNLRENYLKPFEIAVKEGGVNAAMSAFNRLGATWCGANGALLQDILREEWGFRGSVITDYAHGDYMNIDQGLRAGNDLWLEPNENITYGMNRGDPTTVAAAKAAAKNILYTYVSTYNSATGLKLTDAVFPWWVAVLVAADIVVVGTAVVGAIFIFKLRKENPNETNGSQPDNTETNNKEDIK